jgi:hypothetical protein
MAYIIGRYRVMNYAEWRRVLDEHKASYQDLGVTDLHVFRNDYEPNILTPAWRSKPRAWSSCRSSLLSPGRSSV